MTSRAHHAHRSESDLADRNALHGIQSYANSRREKAHGPWPDVESHRRFHWTSRVDSSPQQIGKKIHMTTLTDTIPDSAQHPRLDCTTVYRLIGTGELPSIIIGGFRRVTTNALAGYRKALGSR